MTGRGSRVVGRGWWLIASAVLLAALPSRHLAAQAKLEDNSFLVEEAYNQPARVMQTILTAEILHGAQLFGAAQEYPLGGPRHQFSYGIFAARDGGTELGDAEVNYRYQARGGEGERLFVAPRFTVLVPLGDADRQGGNGGFGVELAVPVSWEVTTRLSLHGNLSAAWRPSAENALGESATTIVPAAGISAVVFLTPKFNLIAETTWEREATVTGDGTTGYGTAHAVALGARYGIDLPGGVQVVPGAAWMPAVDDAPTRSFLYLSVEHGF